MPIVVKCDCGAKYRVKNELAGRTMRCQTCDERILIEDDSGDDDVMDAIVVSPEASTRQTPTPKTLPRPRQQNRQVEPTDDERDAELLKELEASRRSSNSAASNPGMMRVSYWRHFVAYPKWAFIWTVMLLASIGLVVCVSWFSIPLVLFSLWTSWMYWTRVKTQFIAGCVNPAMILSVNPRLVAVHTNLTQGGGNEYGVIKIINAPIHRMVSGPPQEQQRIATVSFYEGAVEEIDHWTDFSPKLAACVTSKPNDAQRLLDSIDEADWLELNRALKQVPRPYAPGLYRTYAPNTLNRMFHLEPDEIVELIDDHLSGMQNCLLMSAGEMVPHEVNTYVPKNARRDVVAVIESAEVSADISKGLSLTHIGAFYNMRPIGKGVFKWENVVGAFVTDRGLEITLTDEKRLLFRKSHFLTAMKYALETLINEIGRG